LTNSQLGIDRYIYLAASHIDSLAQLDLFSSSFSIEFRNPRNIE